MKIGIWGDSYATRVDNPMLGNTWVDWLIDWGYAIDNHALSGTSLWHSYRHWLATEALYDRQIFLVTAYHRVPIQGIDRISTVSADHLDWHLTKTQDPDQRSRLTAARDYHIWAQEPEFYWRVHELFVEDIHRRRPKTLIIPCFPALQQPGFLGLPDLSGLAKTWQGPSLFEITMIDHDHFGLGLDEMQHYQDQRHCHINEKNNLELALVMRSWLDLAELPRVDISQFHRPGLAKDHYFRRKS